MDYSKDYLWWQREVIYQIFTLSVMDSNGDGIGEIVISSFLDLEERNDKETNTNER